MLAHPMQVLEILLRKTEESAKFLSDSFCGELPDEAGNIQPVFLPAPERLPECSCASLTDTIPVVQGKVVVGIAKDASGEGYTADGAANKWSNKIPNQPGHVFSSLMLFAG